MTEESLLVNVSSRGIALITRAVLEHTAEGEGFLKSDAPLPVGTTLVLRPVEEPESTLVAQVGRVVEARKSVRGPDVPPAGMHVILAEGLAEAEVDPVDEPAGDEVDATDESDEEGDAEDGSPAQ